MIVVVEYSQTGCSSLFSWEYHQNIMLLIIKKNLLKVQNKRDLWIIFWFGSYDNSNLWLDQRARKCICEFLSILNFNVPLFDLGLTVWFAICKYVRLKILNKTIRSSLLKKLELNDDWNQNLLAINIKLFNYSFVKVTAIYVVITYQ